VSLDQTSEASASNVELVSSSVEVPKDTKMLERERLLLESGAPIVT